MVQSEWIISVEVLLVCYWCATGVLLQCRQQSLTVSSEGSSLQWSWSCRKVMDVGTALISFGESAALYKHCFP